MALTTAQYRTMRDLFRGALSVDSANPTDSDVLTFFKQFLADAVGSVALSNQRQFLAGEIARRILSGNFSNASDANVVEFWTALATDANAGSAMGQTAQYQTMKKALVGAFNCDFFNPVIADVLGYLNFFGLSFSGNLATLFPGAYQVIQTDRGLTYGGTMLATAGNTSTGTMALGGAIVGSPVPVWIRVVGASVNVYYDGLGVTPAMSPVLVPGVAIPLTGAGAGLSITPSGAGTFDSGDTWKATCSALADQSGNTKHAVQATAAKQPIIGIGLNGKCDLIFDGVDDQLYTVGLNTDGFMLYTVFRYLASTATRYITDSGPGGSVFRNSLKQGAAAGGNVTAYSGADLSGGVIAVGSYGRAAATYNGVSSSIKAGSNSVVNGTTGAFTAATDRIIGCRGDETAFQNMAILALVWAPPGSFSAADAALNTTAGYGVGSILV